MKKLGKIDKKPGMSRCELTGKGIVTKNLVSHSNIKTKSRAYPNIQKKTFYSLQLRASFKFKVATSTIRNIDKKQGFDVFISQQPDSCLSPNALKVKKRILKKTRRSPSKKQDKEVRSETKN